MVYVVSAFHPALILSMLFSVDRDRPVLSFDSCLSLLVHWVLDDELHR